MNFIDEEEEEVVEEGGGGKRGMMPVVVDDDDEVGLLDEELPLFRICIRGRGERANMRSRRLRSIETFRV